MQRIIRRVSTLSIRTKLFGGFRCVLVILLGVVGRAPLRFLNVASSLMDYAQRVSVLSISRDIDRDLSELHRNVRECGVVGTPDAAIAATALADKVEGEIDKGVATIVNPELQKRIQEVAARFADHRKRIAIISTTA